jgi:hypothetical protein
MVTAVLILPVARLQWSEPRFIAIARKQKYQNGNIHRNLKVPTTVIFSQPKIQYVLEKDIFLDLSSEHRIWSMLLSSWVVGNWRIEAARGACAGIRKFSKKISRIARAWRAHAGLTVYPPWIHIADFAIFLARRDHRKSKFGLRIYDIKLIELSNCSAQLDSIKF